MQCVTPCSPPLSPSSQENDPAGWWEETFNGHVDSKPRGPNAIGFDVLLHDTQHVFGLPERATQFSLAPTIGEAARGVSEWRPCM